MVVEKEAVSMGIHALAVNVVATDGDFESVSGTSHPLESQGELHVMEPRHRFHREFPVLEVESLRREHAE